MVNRTFIGLLCGIAAVVIGVMPREMTAQKAPAPSARTAPAIRTADAMREAIAALFTEARAAAEKEGVKTLVALPSFGYDDAGRLPPFVQEMLLAAFDGGPAVVPPPAAVKAPPKPLNPDTLGRLPWRTRESKETPTVLAAIATRTHNGTDLSLTLLDGKQVLWHGSLQLSREEIAALPLTPPLNLTILRFAVDHRGEVVGNGECWTLADEALKFARASHPDAYVWGQAVAPGEPVFPGDIVQFTSVRLEKGGNWVILGDPQHTAIIKKWNAPGQYELIQQNFGDPRSVREMPVDLNTKTAGEFVIYRPLPLMPENEKK